MDYKMIILVIIFIVVIIAILSGAGFGIYYYITGPPEKPPKCRTDETKYSYMKDNKEECCETTPTEWSRWQRSYTKC